MSASARCRSSSSSARRIAAETRGQAVCACSSVRLATSEALAPWSTRWRAPARWCRRHRSAAPWRSRVGEHLLREAHRGEGHRHRDARRCGCRCARAWPPLKLCWNSRSRRNPARRRRAPLVGFLHLAEDLRLAQHHRIEPGGDAEQMPRRGAVLGARTGYRRAGPPGPVRCRASQAAGSASAPLDPAIDLGAVAGREHRRLAHAGLRQQVRAALRGGARARTRLARAARAGRSGG
jgi:hypothetical protein